MPEQIVAQLVLSEGIEYAELNYYVYSTFLPNDALYPLQWNLDNRGTGGIHMEKAWNIQQCARGVVVAVIDTGVAYEDFESFQAGSRPCGREFRSRLRFRQ